MLNFVCALDLDYELILHTTLFATILKLLGNRHFASKNITIIFKNPYSENSLPDLDFTNKKNTISPTYLTRAFSFTLINV